MRTLVYKRTHTGDPDDTGCFGIHDCMGNVRNRSFEAVIGVGGIGSEAKVAGISGRVTWIGIGARKVPLDGGRGCLVEFDHFKLFDRIGPDFREIAPTLAERIYSKNIRTVVNFNRDEQAEIDRILELAETAPASKAPKSGVPIKNIKKPCQRCRKELPS